MSNTEIIALVATCIGVISFALVITILYKNYIGKTLSETEDGYRFAYDADYLSSENPRAVSLTLPLRDEPYDSSTLFSFFDGLIPEGWLLNVVTRNWKLNRKDRFGLLLVACRDTIGKPALHC